MDTLRNPPKHPKAIYYLADGTIYPADAENLADVISDKDEAVIIYKPVEWANIRTSTKIVIEDRAPLHY